MHQKYRNTKAKCTQANHRLLFIKLWSLLPLIFAWPSACLNVAQDRTELEEQVGHAQLDHILVDIKDGLASVREFSVQTHSTKKDLFLELWAQAPSLEINLDIKAQEHTEAKTDDVVSIELKLYNVMSNSQVFLTQTSSQTLSQTEINVEYIAPTIMSTQLTLKTGTYHIHVVPPQPPGDQSWKFAVFADVQERLNGVADLFIPLGQEELKFALISGDLTEQGRIEELKQFQKQQLTYLPFPCYATLGNHELGTDGVPFYHYFGRGSFSFEYGEARFTLIDGASASIAPRTQARLNTWLDQGAEQLHVLATHIPLLDPDGTRGGAHASRLEAAKLLNDLQAHHLDLLLYGHVHTYRYFYQAGIPTIISGGGGSIPMRLDGIGRHYVVFEINQARDGFSHQVQRIYPEE